MLSRLSLSNLPKVFVQPLFSLKQFEPLFYFRNVCQISTFFWWGLQIYKSLEGVDAKVSSVDAFDFSETGCQKNRRGGGSRFLVRRGSGGGGGARGQAAALIEIMPLCHHGAGRYSLKKSLQLVKIFRGDSNFISILGEHSSNKKKRKVKKSLPSFHLIQIHRNWNKKFQAIAVTMVIILLIKNSTLF